jgi:hypothetical protein
MPPPRKAFVVAEVRASEVSGQRAEVSEQKSEVSRRNPKLETPNPKRPSET